MHGEMEGIHDKVIGRLSQDERRTLSRLLENLYKEPA
jgi:hypothetical protein